MNSPEHLATPLGRNLGSLALGCWEPPSRGPMQEWAWSDLLGFVARERLEGLLVSAVADFGLSVTDSQEQDIAAMESRLVLADRLLVAIAGTVSQALDLRGIEHRLLKGLALGRLDYGDPLWRSSGDVDLLVAPEDYAESATVLAGMGAKVPTLDSREKSFAASLQRVEVDVHRRIVAGPVGFLASDGWFEGSRPVDLDGVNVLALDRERAFLHACLNAISNDWYERPRALLDVALLVSQSHLDLIRVRDLVGRWGVSPVVVDALTAAANQYAIDVTPLVDEIKEIRVRRADRAICVLDSQGSRTYSTRLLTEAYCSGRSWRERTAYLAQTRRADRGTLWGLPITSSPIRALRRYFHRTTRRDPRV